MNIEDFRNYCLSKPLVTESFPFDEKTLVFKVNNKIFALADVTECNLSFNVKCNPELAVELREQYDWILPGFHMNKKHWNTVNYNGTNSKLLKEQIDHSYQVVVCGMTKKARLMFL